MDQNIQNLNIKVKGWVLWSHSPWRWVNFYACVPKLESILSENFPHQWLDVLSLNNPVCPSRTTKTLDLIILKVWWGGGGDYGLSRETPTSINVIRTGDVALGCWTGEERLLCHVDLPLLTLVGHWCQPSDGHELLPTAGRRDALRRCGPHQQLRPVIKTRSSAHWPPNEATVDGIQPAVIISLVGSEGSVTICRAGQCMTEKHYKTARGNAMPQHQEVYWWCLGK